MKKRFLAILVMTAILVGSLPIVQAAQAQMVGTGFTFYVYTKNGKGLNLREEPSKDSRVLASIPYGTKLTIYSFYNSTWANVSYKGHSGYVMQRYLVDYKPAPHQGGGGGGTTPSTPSNMFKNFYTADYYVTVRPSTPSGYVNLRWAPSKSMAIHTTYYADTVLRVIAEDGTWCQVYDEVNHVSGFMMKSFLITSVGVDAGGGGS